MDMTPRPYEFIIVSDGDPDHLPPKVFAEALAEFAEITKGATLIDDDGNSVPTMDVSFLPFATDVLPKRILTDIAAICGNDHVRAYSYSYGDTLPSKDVRATMPHQFEWPDEYGDDIEVDGREQVILLAAGHDLDHEARTFIEEALQRGHQILVIDEGLWQLDAITELEQPMSEIDTMQAELDALTASEEATPEPSKVRTKVKTPQPVPDNVAVTIPSVVQSIDEVDPVDPNFGVTAEDDAPMVPEQIPVTPAGEHDGQQGEHTGPPLNPEWEAMGRNELRDLVKEKGLHPTDFRSKQSLLDCLYGRPATVKPQRRSPLKKKQDEVEAMTAMDAEIPAIIKALKGVLEEQQGTLDNQQVVLAKLEALLTIGERVGES